MTNKTYHFNINIGVAIAIQKVDVYSGDQWMVAYENNAVGFKLLLKDIKT
jgi:hypothetical protein